MKRFFYTALIMFLGGCMMAQQANYPHGLPTAEESAQASEDIPLLVDEIIRKQEQSASHHIEDTAHNENQFGKIQIDEIRDNIYLLRVRDESYVERTKEWLIANKKDTIPYLIQALEEYKRSKLQKPAIITFAILYSVIVAPLGGTTQALESASDYNLVYQEIYKILRYNLKEEARPHLEKVISDPQTSEKLTKIVKKLLKQIQEDSSGGSKEEESKPEE